jgi:hypothetical protein
VGIVQECAWGDIKVYSECESVVMDIVQECASGDWFFIRQSLNT